MRDELDALKSGLSESKFDIYVRAYVPVSAPRIVRTRGCMHACVTTVSEACCIDSQ